MKYDLGELSTGSRQLARKVEIDIDPSELLHGKMVALPTRYPVGGCQMQCIMLQSEQVPGYILGNA